MATINYGLNLTNELKNTSNYLLGKKHSDYSKHVKYSDGSEKSPTLTEYIGIELLQEKLITGKSSFELEEYSNYDLFSSNILGTEQLDETKEKSLRSPKVSCKEKEALLNFGTSISKQSSSTLLSPSPFTNGCLDGTSPAFDHYKATSNPLIPNYLRDGSNNNDGPQGEINDVCSTAIENFKIDQNCSSVFEISSKKYIQDVSSARNDKDISATQLLRSPIKNTNSAFKSTVPNTEELNKGKLREAIEKARKDIGMKAETDTAETRFFKPNFDPRYGKSGTDSKLTEILLYEMKTPNNYVDVVIKQIEEDLANLKNKNSFYDKMMQFITKNSCATANENYFLLKEKLAMVKLNPWCAFENDFWEGFLIEEKTYGSIQSSSVEEEENSSSFSIFKEANDQFNDFLNKEHAAHSADFIEYCSLKARLIV